MLKVLCTAEFDDLWEEKMKEYCDIKIVGFSLTKQPKDRLNEEQLIKALEGVEVFIVGYEKVTENVLYNAPDVKLLLSVRDGPEENIDIEACTKLGIPVLFSAGRCGRSVPEFTFLLIMALAKPLIKVVEEVRAGNWVKENDLKFRRINENSTEVFDKTLGIIGLGRNGIGLAQRAQAFGMKIIGFDPFVDREKMKEMDIEVLELNAVMEQSDYVVLLARVTEKNKGMIGKNEIALMKPSACLVNTGRAALLDMNALFCALKEDRIRGAALDVLDEEPPSKDHPIYGIDPDKLIITPHTAGVSVERITFQSRVLDGHLRNYLKGILPQSFCNREVLKLPQFEGRGKKLFGVTEKSIDNSDTIL